MKLNLQKSAVVEATECNTMAPNNYACILLLPLTILSGSSESTGRDNLKQWHRSISDMSYDGCWSDENRNRYTTKGDNNGVVGACGEDIFRVVDCGSKGARWDYNYKVSYYYIRCTIYTNLDKYAALLYSAQTVAVAVSV